MHSVVRTALTGAGRKPMDMYMGIHDHVYTQAKSKQAGVRELRWQHLLNIAQTQHSLTGSGHSSCAFSSSCAGHCAGSSAGVSPGGSGTNSRPGTAALSSFRVAAALASSATSLWGAYHVCTSLDVKQGQRPPQRPTRPGSLHFCMQQDLPRVPLQGHACRRVVLQHVRGRGRHKPACTATLSMNAIGITMTGGAKVNTKPRSDQDENAMIVGNANDKQARLTTAIPTHYNTCSAAIARWTSLSISTDLPQRLMGHPLGFRQQATAQCRNKNRQGSFSWPLNTMADNDPSKPKRTKALRPACNVWACARAPAHLRWTRLQLLRALQALCKCFQSRATCPSHHDSASTPTFCSWSCELQYMSSAFHPAQMETASGGCAKTDRSSWTTCIG